MWILRRVVSRAGDVQAFAHPFVATVLIGRLAADLRVAAGW
jgi:hypothetical protein